MPHDLIIGVALPANVETAARKLLADLKAEDTHVEEIKGKLPTEGKFAGLYLAWKYWAKGTSDALIQVVLKMAGPTASALMPIWPAGAVAAAITLTADKALDDTFIAGEYAKLNVWRETFKAAGFPPIGPAPTPPPGIGGPGSGTDLITNITRSVMIGGGILAGLLILGAVLRK